MIDEKAKNAVAKALYEAMEGPVSNQDFARQQRQWESAQALAVVALEALESAKPKEAEEAGSERLANLVEGMIKESPYDRWPQSRMALAIAANAVRRGRHLTAEEKMRNLVDALEEDGPLPDHVRAGLLHDR